MSGKASSSKPNIDLSGSGGLSYAYIQYLPLQCNNHGSKVLFYDDGNKLLLSPTSDQVFSWKLVPFDPHVGPTIDLVSEGPIVTIRYSLDVKVIAIQRSYHEINFKIERLGKHLLIRAGENLKAYLDFCGQIVIHALWIIWAHRFSQIFIYEAWTTFLKDNIHLQIYI